MNSFTDNNSIAVFGGNSEAPHGATPSSAAYEAISEPPPGIFEDEPPDDSQRGLITSSKQAAPSASMTENLAQRKRDITKRCTEAAQRAGKPLLFGMTTSLLLQAVPLPAECNLDLTALHTVASSHRKRLRGAPQVIPHVWKPLNLAHNIRVNKHVYALDLVHTWAQLAMHCSLDSLIVLGDAIVTATARKQSLAQDRSPEEILQDMACQIAELPKFNAKSVCLTALTFMAARVDSPKESEARITITKYGIPKPVTNYVVPGLTFSNGAAITLDMAWPEFRVAIEYDGDHHRTDKTQWRRDQEKREKLRHHDWTVIIATGADLADEPSRAEFAYRVARQLALRGATFRFTVTETPLEQLARRKPQAARV